METLFDLIKNPSTQIRHDWKMRGGSTPVHFWIEDKYLIDCTVNYSTRWEFTDEMTEPYVDDSTDIDIWKIWQFTPDGDESILPHLMNKYELILKDFICQKIF